MNSRLLILLAFVFVGCRSEYDNLVRTEMASGERYKDLLFDFEFNQTREKFYEQCWEMNKTNIISQGPKNEYVMYILKPGTVKDEEDKIEMLFYGIFDKDMIMRGMDFRFSYPKWSLWSEEYHADKLIPSIKNYFIDKFPGNDFITVPLKTVDQNSYVKVDGNRQIIIYAADTKDVVVKVEDLSYKLVLIEANEN